MSDKDAEVQQKLDDEATEAAFIAASSPDASAPVEPVKAEPVAEVEVVVEKEPVAEVTPPVAPPATGLSEDQLKLLSAIPELERRLTQQVDKVAGNYGEMKRLLDTMQKAAATPRGAAEFEASEDGDYLDRELPEIAGGVAEKIEKAIAKIPAGLTSEQLAEQFDAMYKARRKQEDVETNNELVAALEKAHPDRFEIQKTPQWGQWMESLTDAQRQGVMHSRDLYYVSGMISKFKSYRDKQTALAEKSKQRIESAVTPSGVRPTGPSTITEDEAMQKAFAAALTEK